MKQIQRVIPGFDCERGHCPSKGCPGFGSPKRPGGGHGIRGDIWAYAVVADDGMAAVELRVGTRAYPNTVPKGIYADRPFVAWCQLELHVGFPTEPEAMAWWTPELKGNCDLLPGTWCDRPWIATYAYAEQFFTEHGITTQDNQAQPDSFWTALEGLLVEQRSRLTRADEKWTRCLCCDGHGILSK